MQDHPLLIGIAQLAANHDWGEVRQRVARSLSVLHSGASIFERTEVLAVKRQLALWRLRSLALWWCEPSGGGIRLRRTQQSDASFLRTCYADENFAWQFNRQRPWTGDLDRACRRAGLASPVDTKSLMWIVETVGGEPKGLASLSGLDMANRRVEVALGFPRSPLRGEAIYALLLTLNFVFFGLEFNKVTAQVYEQNQDALKSAERAGFRREGFLDDHYLLPPGKFVSVHVLGMTKRQLMSNLTLVEMGRRRLGLRWSDGDSTGQTTR